MFESLKKFWKGVLNLKNPEMYSSQNEDETVEKGFLERVRSAWHAFVAEVNRLWRALTTPIKKFFQKKLARAGESGITRFLANLFSSEKDQHFVNEVGDGIGQCIEKAVDKDDSTAGDFVQCAAEQTVPIIFSWLFSKEKNDPNTEATKIKSDEESSFLSRLLKPFRR